MRDYDAIFKVRVRVRAGEDPAEAEVRIANLIDGLDGCPVVTGRGHPRQLVVLHTEPDSLHLIDPETQAPPVVRTFKED
jgi:hypothetical protein